MITKLCFQKAYFKSLFFLEKEQTFSNG